MRAVKGERNILCAWQVGNSYLCFSPAKTQDLMAGKTFDYDG